MNAHIPRDKHTQKREHSLRHTTSFLTRTYAHTTAYAASHTHCETKPLSHTHIHTQTSACRLNQNSQLHKSACTPGKVWELAGIVCSLVHLSRQRVQHRRHCSHQGRDSGVVLGLGSSHSLVRPAPHSNNTETAQCYAPAHSPYLHCAAGNETMV